MDAHEWLSACLRHFERADARSFWHANTQGRKGLSHADLMISNPLTRVVMVGLPGGCLVLATNTRMEFHKGFKDSTADALFFLSTDAHRWLSLTGKWRYSLIFLA